MAVSHYKNLEPQGQQQVRHIAFPVLNFRFQRRETEKHGERRERERGREGEDERGGTEREGERGREIFPHMSKFQNHYLVAVCFCISISATRDILECCSNTSFLRMDY